MSQLKRLDAMYNKVFVNREPLHLLEINAINDLIDQLDKQEIDDIDEMLLNKIILILEESEKLLKRSHLKLIS